MPRSPVRLKSTPSNAASEAAPLPGERPDPQRLHKATDRLNEVLTRFEEALAALKLGVAASVVLDEAEDGSWIQYLSFTKTHGSFKLVVEAGQEGTPESFNTTPITSASRETRLTAVEHLPTLYKALLKEFDAEVTRVNESITRVEELERALRTKAAE